MSEDPPANVDENAAKVPAENQPVADALNQAGSANASTANATEPLKLPPAIFGGMKGEFVFEVSTFLPAVSADSTAIGESSSARARHGASNAAEDVQPLQQTATTQLTVDKAYTSLFDLKPLFMGIQADIHRRRALLGGKCLMSLNDVVQYGICKSGHSKEDGQCTLYSVPPMSVAMQTLFNRPQSISHEALHVPLKIKKLSLLSQIFRKSARKDPEQL